MALKNTDLWNMLRNHSPSFKSLTAEATANTFTTQGVMALTSNPTALNEYFKIAMPFFQQFLMPPRAKDIFSEKDMGEKYPVPWGGFVRRLYGKHLKPLSPAYTNLQDGVSVDQQVVRKGTFDESFWAFNYNYANRVTLPFENQILPILTSEAGLSEVTGALLAMLDASLTAEEGLIKMEALGMGISDATRPLQSSQIISVSGMTGDYSQQAAQAFVLAVRQAITLMTSVPYTGAYNQAGYETVQDKSRLRLIVRAGLLDWLALIAATNAAPLERLSIPVEVIEVPHFGGLEPYADEDLTTKLYPVYRSTGNVGEQIGWATTADADTPNPAYNDSNIYYKDTHADTYALLCDKGLLFECEQMGRRTAPSTPNEWGLYTNMNDTWPNRILAYDHHYNAIAFQDSTAAAAAIPAKSTAKASSKLSKTSAQMVTGVG